MLGRSKIRYYFGVEGVMSSPVNARRQRVPNCKSKAHHCVKPGRKSLSTQTSLRRSVPAVNAMRVPSG